ncbi:hypothetical protein HK102_003783 [Quaeritorhiza haematococci]|nr:hypothetical protein HK102_003783 [Quaeritorhiza haematococci]
MKHQGQRPFPYILIGPAQTPKSSCESTLPASFYLCKLTGDEEQPYAIVEIPVEGCRLDVAERGVDAIAMTSGPSVAFSAHETDTITIFGAALDHRSFPSWTWMWAPPVVVQSPVFEWDGAGGAPLLKPLAFGHLPSSPPGTLSLISISTQIAAGASGWAPGLYRCDVRIVDEGENSIKTGWREFGAAAGEDEGGAISSESKDRNESGDADTKKKRKRQKARGFGHDDETSTSDKVVEIRTEDEEGGRNKRSPTAPPVPVVIPATRWRIVEESILRLFGTDVTCVQAVSSEDFCDGVDGEGGNGNGDDDRAYNSFWLNQWDSADFGSMGGMSSWDTNISYADGEGTQYKTLGVGGGGHERGGLACESAPILAQRFWIGTAAGKVVEVRCQSNGGAAASVVEWCVDVGGAAQEM